MHFDILKINWTESFKTNPQVLLLVVVGVLGSAFINGVAKQTLQDGKSRPKIQFAPRRDS